jgi:hypothetical protein
MSPITQVRSGSSVRARPTQGLHLPKRRRASQHVSELTGSPLATGSTDVATGPPAAIYKDEEAGSALTDWDPKVGEVDRVTLRTWVEAYEQAWRTSGTEGLDTLFAEDATYQTAPFEDPFRGLAAISAMWEEERSGPDEAFALRSEVVAVEGDTGVVRVEVRYGEPASQTYRNLWLVRLNDEGRCTTFEEWPFWHPGSEGEFANGPPEYGDR